ncbi:GILT-like protein 1 [Macrosteles quadrilineatus]|uniref:GILT-like protein 1 n=1 Tax=Macrosteles quadrilineatus TaxID=74068 RepID=UPI0023E127EA|nr:GILT-like protein 1 [Macrosteles quadrilineatus]
MKTTTILMLFVTFILYHEIAATPGKKNDSVNVTVLYESYCPGCANLFVHQIYKVWQELKNHMELDLVPYGNTNQVKRGGRIVFDCQHGPAECHADLLHACAIHQACGARGTRGCPKDKLQKAVDYIKCVMEHPDQAAASDLCASQSRLQSVSINQCAKGSLGYQLKLNYARRTMPWRARPDFPGTPCVIINDKFNMKDEYAALKNLRSVVCKYIPDKC